MKQSNENSELSVTLKMESDSGTKMERLSKENQTNITRLQKPGIKSNIIEEEKERMISN